MPAQSLPRATLGDSLGVALDVFLPNVAKGVIIRRPRAVALSESLHLDSRAVRRMQRLRAKYGDGPLLIAMPGRVQAVILSPDHVRRVLAETPAPFAADSSEKRAALSHFEPHGVLISHGAERVDRRRFNDEVLDSNRPRHRLAERFSSIVREECADLIATARSRGELRWSDWTTQWYCTVRRIVFGDAARGAHEITDLLAALRHDANWAFMRPKRDRLRRRLLALVKEQLDRAEPGSLASVIAQVPTTPDTDPAGQVPQWLFAFDAAGMASYRALALLSTHSEYAERARVEIASAAGQSAAELPFLRACVLDVVRLWPTTPMILRQTTRATEWKGGTIPAGAGVLVFVPFFHRDGGRIPFADRFAPDEWLPDMSGERWPLIPFSAGPAVCPGQNLVLLVTSLWLSACLSGPALRLQSPEKLDPRRPLPASLDFFGLRFAITQR